MGKKIWIILLILFSSVANAQQLPSNIRADINSAASDSGLIKGYRLAVSFFRDRNRDSANYYINLGIPICKKNRQPIILIFFLSNKAYELTAIGKYGDAMNYILEAGKLLSEIKRDDKLWKSNQKLTIGENIRVVQGNLYYLQAILLNETMNYSESSRYFELAEEPLSSVSDSSYRVQRLWCKDGVILNYHLTGEHSKALALLDSLYPGGKGISRFTSWIKGITQTALGKYESASQCLLNAVDTSTVNVDGNTNSRAYLGMARLHLLLKNTDSSIFYTRRLTGILKQLNAPNHEVNMGLAYQLLSDAYHEKNIKDSAGYYGRLALYVKDSLNEIRLQNMADFQKISFEEQQRLRQLQQEQKDSRTQVQLFLLIAFVVVILIVAAIQYRNNIQRKKANVTLQKALKELNETQSQLIQSEKMASLGELTAGIAHEIQNPLNFVNNFSEVNTELIDELAEELDKGNLDDVKAIAKDIKENEQKINHHGKRADAIVKGMLQHSRSSSGVKEPTDINALADEYLRLAYHGLRAKDKSFNATMKTDFDTSIGNIDIIPQDIGRVIVNLITNAFYAVDEKKKQLGEGFEPIVTVSTKKHDDKIEIGVKDNGNGIPAKVIDKIFQPFFTTKPTGQGTGLGLSLSYDIVKAHGGELKAETKEGEGSVFIISIPV